MIDNHVERKMILNENDSRQFRTIHGQ